MRAQDLEQAVKHRPLTDAERSNLQVHALEKQVQSLPEALARREKLEQPPALLVSHPDAYRMLPDNRTHYVVGFLFMPDIPSRHNQFQGHEVVLIRKNRPKWQQGLLNGVGGRVEPNESPAEAMVREFSEETGRPSSGWMPFVDMIFDDCVVHVFGLRVKEAMHFDSGLTDEKIEVWNVSDLMRYSNKIPNLNWLVPLVLCTAPPMYPTKMFFQS